MKAGFPNGREGGAGSGLTWPMLITRDPRRDAWLFFGLALLLLGTGLGLRDPWPADEPRFALVAKQMIESGRWLFPMRGDELYPDKPPLFMWMQAASYVVFGSWRIAFLLPSLLCALGTLWLTCDLGRRLWNRRVGLYAGYALLLALQFSLQAKRAQIDPAITFLVTLSVYGLLRHVLRGPDWPMFFLGFVAAGLGVITKGVDRLARVPAGRVRARAALARRAGCRHRRGADRNRLVPRGDSAVAGADAGCGERQR
jgi:4-amino-4-deoxy-L-arabinose transferase-like glycosyltransferase